MNNTATGTNARTLPPAPAAGSSTSYALWPQAPSLTTLPSDLRALRFGLLAGGVYQLASIAWDAVLADAFIERLLWVHIAGAVACALLAAASFKFVDRLRGITISASVVLSALTAYVASVLPYGFGYGIGGNLLLALGLVLALRDGRSALLAGGATVLTSVVTLLLCEASADTVIAIAAFSLPGFFLSTVLCHSTSVRRERERAVRAQLDALHEDLERFGANDALTGVYGHKQLQALGRREISLARRRKTALSAIKIDVEKLSDINNNYGWQSGDETLRAVASMCQATLRETDVLARVDGDKFVAVLPDASSDGAAIIRDRLQQKLEKASVLAGERVLQVSVRVAAATLREGDKTLDDLLKRADEQLSKPAPTA